MLFSKHSTCNKRPYREASLLRLALFCCLLFSALPLAAQSDNQVAPLPKLSIDHDPAEGATSLSWFGHPGKVYFLQTTPDLKTGWQYIDAIYGGADAPLSHLFTSDADSGFFRLLYGDNPNPGQDLRTGNLDNDYLSNADEISLFGTNPLLFDTNSDDLGDGYGVLGSVKMEVWNDIDTNLVSFLTSDPAFPFNSDSTLWLQRLESPINTDDYYGGRVRGFIVPDQTRDYVF